MTVQSSHDRDFVGYGRNPPDPKWPDGARIALNICINYEEGSEASLADGDGFTETALTEGGGGFEGRDLAAESMFEYGSRVGFWRLVRLLSERNMTATVMGCALALERNPDATAAIREHGYDVCAHGWRWERHQHLGEDEERERIRKTVASLTRTIGERPLGWYCRYGAGVNTRRLVVEEGGFLYDSDSYADDLPYWIHDFGRPHLVIPYSLDTNDMRFAMHPGFVTGDEFFCYLRDAFETLYAEGETAPKMMSIGLHCRLSGRPGRSRGLERFLDLVQSRDRVWLCRRIDIAKHWHALHGAVSASPNQCDQ